MAIVLNQGAQPVECNIVLYQGDYFTANLEFRDANAAPVNITGFSGLAQIKDNVGTQVGQFTVTIPVGTDGIAAITLESSDSELLPAGTYNWDFQLSDDSVPARKRTYFKGTVTVTEDISA